MNVGEAAPLTRGERARPNNGESSGDIMSPETYYEILGVSESADDDAVKQAFRDLAKHYHPDRNPNDEDAEGQFKRINTAYEGLKDASRREAYNEWLEFAEKRTKVRRTQWGRLAALVFLLLLGPSAVLYWAVVIADIPLFTDSADKIAASDPPREASLPPPRPERRPPLSPAESAPPQPLTANSSATAPQPGNAPQAAVPAGRLNPPPPPATAGDNRPQADRPNSASLPEPNRNAANSNRTPGTATANPSPPAKNGVPLAEKTYTQALPAQPAPAEARSQSEEAQGKSETARSGEATDRPTAGEVSSFPVPDLDQDQGPGSQGARGTARMLARLKEPQGAQPGAALPSETLPAATENAAPPSRQGLPPDAFSDCDECPVISAAGSNEMFGGGDARAAVSLTEITLADWDGCVADRACPPLDLPARGSRRETIVEVGPREAEAYANWLSTTSGKAYRHVMSPRRREAEAQRCNGARRNSSGWEWLDDNADRNCPPPSASEQSPDARRGFRVFRRVVP
jgi:curved DNA-binding protein CbpA